MVITSIPTKGPTIVIRFLRGTCYEGVDYGPEHLDEPVEVPAHLARRWLDLGLAERVNPEPGSVSAALMAIERQLQGAATHALETLKAKLAERAEPAEDADALAERAEPADSGDAQSEPEDAEAGANEPQSQAQTPPPPTARPRRFRRSPPQ